VKWLKKLNETVLTVKQKLEFIEKFENREFATKLAKDYGIGIQTIRDIKNNKMKLTEFVKDCDGGRGCWTFQLQEYEKFFIQRDKCCHSSVVQPQMTRRNIRRWLPSGLQRHVVW
jgi:hypothetical protein